MLLEHKVVKLILFEVGSGERYLGSHRREVNSEGAIDFTLPKVLGMCTLTALWPPT
jgi:hypothetical protein